MNPCISENYEEQIVGYCICEPNYALGKVEVDWLDDHRLRVILGSAKKLATIGKPVEPHLICHQLYEDGLLEEIGGSAYLGFLVAQASCETVFDSLLSDLRVDAKTKVYQRVAEEMKENPEKAEQIMATIESRLPKKPDESSVNESLLRVLDKVERHIMNPGSLLGTSTGFRFLDGLTSGMQAGQLWIVAARPGIGKTTFLLNMILKMTERVGFISLEMTQDELVHRLWFAEAQVPMSCSKTGFSEQQLKDLTLAQSRIKKKNILISDAPRTSISDVSAEARLLKAKGAGVIMVDYLQLIHADGKRAENRVAEITHVSNSLKRIARELQLPIVSACQLNREAAKEGVKPDLYHLRESGSIEQDADLVLMLHQANEHELGLLVRKNRVGPLEASVVGFDKSRALVTEK